MSLLNPQLAAFAAVLGEGSFDAAAQRLSLTPSAISQRIKALEDRLGQVLILRRTPCEATPAGKRLLGSVQQLRLLEAETLKAFHAASDDAGPTWLRSPSTPIRSPPGSFPPSRTCMGDTNFYSTFVSKTRTIPPIFFATARYLARSRPSRSRCKAAS